MSQLLYHVFLAFLADFCGSKNCATDGQQKADSEHKDKPSYREAWTYLRTSSSQTTMRLNE